MNAVTAGPLLSTRARTALGVGATLGTFVAVRELAAAFDVGRPGQVAVVVAVALATWLLHRGGSSWSALGLRRPGGIVRPIVVALAVYLATALVLVALVRPLATLLGLPPQNIEAWEGLRGNLPALGLALAMVWTTVALGEGTAVPRLPATIPRQPARADHRRIRAGRRDPGGPVRRAARLSRRGRHVDRRRRRTGVRVRDAADRRQPVAAGARARSDRHRQPRRNPCRRDGPVSRLSWPP
jgi:hypothetical protein